MVKKRILITGINSLLGRYLVRVLKKDYALFGTIHIHRNHLLPLDRLFPLDITDAPEVKRLVSRIKPHVVIHLAALSNIDYCEQHPEDAYKINFVGTKNLAAATLADTHFIFSSSNAVFSGIDPPYAEEDKTHPLNVYARTKETSSEYILHFRKQATILRFTSMFGWPPLGARDNDVTFYLRKLRQNREIFLVDDLHFNPVSAEQAAAAVTQIVKKKHTGIFHIGGKTSITRYTFVKQIVKVFAPQTRTKLIPVPGSFFPHLTPRPPDATLTTSKMENLLHIKPLPLYEALLEIKSEGDYTAI